PAGLSSRAETHPLVAGVVRCVREMGRAVRRLELVHLGTGRSREKGSGRDQNHPKRSSHDDSILAESPHDVAVKRSGRNHGFFTVFYRPASIPWVAGADSSATASTSSIVSARCTVRLCLTAGGTSSSKFFSLRRGSTTVRRPARWAARTFSLMPPTGNTPPHRLISPLIPRSGRTRPP